MLLAHTMEYNNLRSKTSGPDFSGDLLTSVHPHSTPAEGIPDYLMVHPRSLRISWTAGWKRCSEVPQRMLLKSPVLLCQRVIFLLHIRHLSAEIFSPNHQLKKSQSVCTRFTTMIYGTSTMQDVFVVCNH